MKFDVNKIITDSLTEVSKGVLAEDGYAAEPPKKKAVEDVKPAEDKKPAEDAKSAEEVKPVSGPIKLSKQEGTQIHSHHHSEATPKGLSPFAKAKQELNTRFAKKAPEKKEALADATVPNKHDKEAIDDVINLDKAASSGDVAETRRLKLKTDAHLASHKKVEPDSAETIAKRREDTFEAAKKDPAEAEAATRAARAARGHEAIAKADAADKADDAKAEAATRAARAARGAEDLADKEAHGTTVAGHLKKSFDKIKDDATEGASKLGHKVASHLSNLDYEKTGLAGAAGIAAGLGALALRKRLKKVK